MRLSPQPIQKIWILYDENRSDDRFGFSAQDNTLSGAIVFSCEEFEFRMWDHVNLPAKK